MLLMPASLSRPAMPEVCQFRWPTPGSWLSGPVRQFLSSAAAPRAAPPRMNVPAPAPARVLIRELRAARPASQLHGAIAENGHIRAGTPEDSGHDRHASNAIPEDPWPAGRRRCGTWPATLRL